jgi:hypothetical protein
MATANEVWIGMVEVRPFKDSKLLDDATGAFVNVLTWAASEDEFCAKARELMDHLHLDLVRVEKMEPLKNRGLQEGLEEEIAQIAEEIRSTPDAIRYSTFHTWTEQIN